MRSRCQSGVVENLRHKRISQTFNAKQYLPQIGLLHLSRHSNNAEDERRTLTQEVLLLHRRLTEAEKGGQVPNVKRLLHLTTTERMSS